MPPVHEVMNFLDDLFVAAAMIVVTTLVHAIGLDRIMALIGNHIDVAKGVSFRVHIYKILLGVASILGIFLLVTIHVWLWAFMYEALAIKEFHTLEEAVYFSTVTFTTLGYGDIVLKDSWRVLSGIEAANGIVLLGWSTAFLFEIMTQLYPRRRNS